MGILIVGLGGNNGVTLLAGMMANTRHLSWETSTSGGSGGRVSAPNWGGCITQLSPKGQHGTGGGFQQQQHQLDGAGFELIVNQEGTSSCHSDDPSNIGLTLLPGNAGKESGVYGGWFMKICCLSIICPDYL